MSLPSMFRLKGVCLTVLLLTSRAGAFLSPAPTRIVTLERSSPQRGSTSVSSLSSGMKCKQPYLPSLSMSLGSKPATWIATTVVGGTLGTPFVVRATTSWYRKISLPDWSPPDRVFAPVWTSLYSCMGYAAFKVYQSTGLSSLPMKLALCHYALNLLWAPVFFGMQKLRLGHAMNLILLSSLLAIIPLFYRVHALSGVLLLPYLLWLMIATKLSETVCRLNPTAKGYNNAMLEASLCKLQKEAAEKVGL